MEILGSCDSGVWGFWDLDTKELYYLRIVEFGDSGNCGFGDTGIWLFLEILRFCNSVVLGFWELVILVFGDTGVKNLRIFGFG